MSQTLLISDDHLKETRNVWFRLGLICGSAISVVILGLVAIVNVDSGDDTDDFNTPVRMVNYYISHETGEISVVRDSEDVLGVCRIFQDRYDGFREDMKGGMITQCLEP